MTNKRDELLIDKYKNKWLSGTLAFPKGIQRIRRNDALRFWLKIKKADSGCWEFQGFRNAWKYGIFSSKNKPISAHRFIWSAYNGPIPKGMYICHHCDNPPCVNPEHLFLGTPSDNTNDMHSKGRAKFQLRDSNANAKLTSKKVEELKRKHAKGAMFTTLGEEYGVDRTTVSRAIRGVSWK